MSEWSGTRLYIGNLPPNTTKTDIESFFDDLGQNKIREVKLMEGFGFIQYDDPADAKDIVPSFHGKEFKGNNLIVQFARGSRHQTAPRDYGAGPSGPGFAPRPRRTPFRMIITGLPPDTSWQDLKDFARKSNENVVYSDMGRDRDGRGVVEFESYEDLKRAVALLDNTEFRGCTVTCVADVSTGAVSGSGGSGGGRYGNSYAPRGRSFSPHRGGGGGYRRYSPTGPRYNSPPPSRGYGGRGGRYDSPPHGGYRERSPPRRGREPYYDSVRGRSPPPRRPLPPPVDDYPPPRAAAPYANGHEDYAPPRRGYEDDSYRAGPPMAGRGSRYDEPRRYPSPVLRGSRGGDPFRDAPPPPARGGGGYGYDDRRRPPPSNRSGIPTGPRMDADKAYR